MRYAAAFAATALLVALIIFAYAGLAYDTSEPLRYLGARIG